MSVPQSAGITLSAREPEEAAAIIADEYTEISVQAPPGRPFSLNLHAFALPHLRYGELSFSESRVRTRTYPSYTLCVPTAGSLIATADDTDDVVYGTEGAVVSPGSRVDAQYLSDGIVIRTVDFEIDLALSELSALLGRTVVTPPRFSFARPDGPGAAAITRAVAVLHDELRNGSPLMAEPVLAERLGRLVLSSLLLGHPHSYSAELQGRTHVEGPRAIRQLLDRVHAAPLDFATVGDLAAAAGLSVRALQDGFRRHVGTSPMTYLRQVRLQKVHEALLAADPSTATATSIAHSWGFAHYGRFVADYRARFGISPTRSLRARPGEKLR